MRTIISGSRGVTTYAVVEEAVRASGITPSVVLSGSAPGVDRLGEKWAFSNWTRLERYPADWEKHGKSAGFMRNRHMADSADALIAVWDGKSRGTEHMIDCARSRGLIVHVHFAPTPNSAVPTQAPEVSNG